MLVVDSSETSGSVPDVFRSSLTYCLFRNGMHASCLFPDFGHAGGMGTLIGLWQDRIGKR